VVAARYRERAPPLALLKIRGSKRARMVVLMKICGVGRDADQHSLFLAPLSYIGLW